ncbi:unnamed protein product [Sphagnum tenellum]
MVQSTLRTTKPTTKPTTKHTTIKPTVHPLKRGLTPTTPRRTTINTATPTPTPIPIEAGHHGQYHRHDDNKTHHHNHSHSNPVATITPEPITMGPTKATPERLTEDLTTVRTKTDKCDEIQYDEFVFELNQCMKVAQTVVDEAFPGVFNVALIRNAICTSITDQQNELNVVEHLFGSKACSIERAMGALKDFHSCNDNAVAEKDIKLELLEYLSDRRENGHFQSTLINMLTFFLHHGLGPALAHGPRVRGSGLAHVYPVLHHDGLYDVQTLVGPCSGPNPLVLPDSNILKLHVGPVQCREVHPSKSGNLTIRDRPIP